MTWLSFAGSVMKPSTNDPALTTARLRHEIDSGRTGDKIANIDPAAAPLGTDEEAAGTPPSREAVRVAMAHEVKRPRASQQQHDHGAGITSPHQPDGLAWSSRASSTSDRIK